MSKVPTRVFDGDGETGVDNDMAEVGFAGIGAWILGRNMFSPIRGPWPHESWKGWWGDEPPYHVRMQRVHDGSPRDARDAAEAQEISRLQIDDEGLGPFSSRQS